ncbi:energy transducer TonB [Pendulispora albinea]|uniref:Energy transducer TonB n=1 Tax=Pendulispora albinea TaxID=2741071 RepID=A0ABZ2MBG9_9BACT
MAEQTAVAALHPNSNWSSCAFPSEAEKVDEAFVTLQALVGPDGKPEAVQVVKDPGFGFGEAAHTCAMANTYVPGVDEAGRRVRAKTVPFRIHFDRVQEPPSPPEPRWQQVQEQP